VHWFGLYLFLHGQQFSCSIEALEKVQKRATQDSATTKTHELL